MNNEFAVLKQKFLRNLDKICLDPLGNFANSQAVEKYWTWGEYYDTGEARKHGQYKITDQNGEEVDLAEYWSFEDEEEGKFYKEIRAAIIDNIKQNPTDWEIYSDGSDSQRGNFLKNKKTGVKHYKSGFTIFIGKINGEWDEEVGARDWAEIEATLKKSPSNSSPQGSQNQEEKKWYNPADYPIIWITVALLSLFLAVVIFFLAKKKKKIGSTFVTLNQRTRRVNKHYSNK